MSYRELTKTGQAMDVPRKKRGQAWNSLRKKLSRSAHLPETAAFRYAAGLLGLGLIFALERGLLDGLDRIPAAPVVGLAGFGVAAIAVNLMGGGS